MNRRLSRFFTTVSAGIIKRFCVAGLMNRFTSPGSLARDSSMSAGYTLKAANLKRLDKLLEQQQLAGAVHSRLRRLHGTGRN